MKRIVTAITYIGMFIVIGIAILTGLDVGGRYLFKSPIKGTFELTEVFFSSIVAFGIAAATAAEEHITIDVLSVKLGPSGQRILKLIRNFVCVLVLAILVWRGSILGLESIDVREETTLLSVPIAPFRFALVFGFFLSFIVLIYQIVNLFRSKTD